MGRLGTALFAALYLAQATWLLHGGFDVLFPRVLKVVAPSADDRCAPHGCGCEEDAQKRRACCCEPATAEAPLPETTRGSAVEAARCAGVETAMAHAAAPPSACERPALAPPMDVGYAGALPREILPDLPVLRRLDKVPL
ncbi:MAG TPA: hypothetical protein VEJ18_14900 [Planctomycetota bacterium]|nr:hypothetical protein [Planctomycetota bacterium]